MKTTLLLVGKTTSKPLSQLVDDYVERVGHFAPFSVEVIPELRKARSLTVEQQKELESDEILNRLKASDFVVLLDERGREFRSVQFADFVQKLHLRGASRVVFIVGGPYGFANSVYERANEKISLSKMTFSHQMIRLLFVEQLYRAYSILNGLPYHHE